VSSGIGSVVSATASGNSVAVNLAGVSNAQVITVKVFGLSDGTNAGELTIPMHVLIGDTSADSVANLADADQTDDLEGQIANASNFRSDVNTDGVINADDTTKVTETAGLDSAAPPSTAPQADIWYEYDDDARLHKLSTPAYICEYNYDHLGRLEWITRPNNSQITYQYTYDPSSNVIGRKSYTNDTSLSFVRDEVNRITDETILQGENPLSTLHHTYDEMSRLKTTTRDGDSLRDRFDYYFTGELKSAEYGMHPDGSGGYYGGATVGYDYDNAGNRSGAGYTPNAFNQYISAPGGPVENGSQHEISSYEGKDYSYRADGQLSAVDPASGVQNLGDAYRLGYDALGRTVRRSMNGVLTYYIYDGARPTIEYNAAGNITADNLYGLGVDEIISRNNNGAVQFLMQDRTGSTVSVTGTKGQLLEQYRYDAFGTPTIMDPAGTGTPYNETQINNRFLFTGREWISRFGFYEYRARAYHPGLGRFMSQDPIGFAAGDLNLFRYCGNDPVNMVDPSGLDQNTITYGMGPGVMLTWGTNNGQRNSGLYFGLGFGLSYTHTPSTSEYVAPGVIKGIAGQYTYGLGDNGSLNVSALSSERGGNVTATTGVGKGRHALQFGVEIDPLKSPPYGPAAPSYGYLNGMFIGIGATSYGNPNPPPPGGSTYVDPNFDGATTERIIVESNYLPSTPSLGSYHFNPETMFFPGFGSGLNSGSHGGASAASVLSTLFETKAGIPGGGGQPGEGSHVVPFELN
jgi:RHS repeat-associated protein